MLSTDWTTSAETAVDAACRRAPDSSGLLREVFDEFHRLLSLRGGALYHHTTSGRPVFLHGSLCGDLERMDPLLLHPDNDPCHQIVARLTPIPRVVHASADVPRDVLRRSACGQQFYRPLRIDHIVCLWLDGRRPPEPGMTGMFLARADEQGPFGAATPAAPRARPSPRAQATARSRWLGESAPETGVANRTRRSGGGPGGRRPMRARRLGGGVPRDRGARSTAGPACLRRRHRRGLVSAHTPRRSGVARTHAAARACG